MFIRHKNKVLTLNIDLVRDQRIDFDTMCEIVVLHKERSNLFDILNATDDITLMRIIFVQLRNIEFELQMLWGFPVNEVLHRSYLWPHCTCPLLDNKDGWPVVQYKDGGCPLHGPDLYP